MARQQESGEFINEAMDAGLGEEFFNHALTPTNVGLLPQPDGYACPKGTCGDYIELYLRVREERIVDARYMPEGCLYTVACGSALTELIKGREVAAAVAVTPEELSEALGGLPKDHHHCAVLAVATLKAAVRDYQKKLREPWKKMYNR
ncbi:MAG: iron-sulfur cluster assembly scaffold protein [Deltaproteobacteria bacterium]|nr:iron-sulfur cluster assembly scaffold protein [Deltaproteobacteria bacterium]